MRDGTDEPVSRDQIPRRERGQGKNSFPCSADHEQDSQLYPVDPYSAMGDDHIWSRSFNSPPDEQRNRHEEVLSLQPMILSHLSVLTSPPPPVWDAQMV